MGDTFLVQPCGRSALNEFLDCLSRNIKFTMEIESSEPFLDVFVYRRSNGSLGYRVYRNPTHTNLDLKCAESSSSGLNTIYVIHVVCRAHVVSDPGSLQDELDLLCRIFARNEYSQNGINWALNRKGKVIM